MEILKTAYEKVENLKRDDLIQKKDKTIKENNAKDNKKNTFLTCTFRPKYQKVPRLVKKNWDILARSATTKELHRSMLKVGYKRPKNLKEMLVRAKTNYHPDQNPPKENKEKCEDGKTNVRKRTANIAQI